MVSLPLWIVSFLVLVTRSSSEFTGTCGPEYGKPGLWDCLVALQRLSDIHQGNPTIRFDAARYEVVRPRAGAPQPADHQSPDPLVAARDNVFEEIILAVDAPSGQIPTLAEIEDLYRPLNTAQDAYEVIETYQALDLSLKVSHSQGFSVAEWRPLSDSKCDIAISWNFPDEGAWLSLDYSNPSWMLLLRWKQIVAAANEIKDNCLTRDGAYGGSNKLGLDDRVQVKLSANSETEKDTKEDGGVIEVAETGRESSRMTRLAAIRAILRTADSGTLSGIEHLLHPEPGNPPTRDGSESKTCRDTSSCGNASGCVYEQLINSAILYGSTLIKKAGRCISLSNLLQDFLSVVEGKD